MYRFFNNLSTIFLFQIWKNRLKITNLKTGKIYDEKSLVVIDRKKDENTIIAIGDKASVYPNPFNYPRVIVNDYETAAILFKFGMEATYERKALFSPLGIIQVMDDFNTKLTELEKKALLDISLNAGCRESIVYEGKITDIEHINFSELKKQFKFINQ